MAYVTDPDKVAHTYGADKVIQFFQYSGTIYYGFQLEKALENIDRGLERLFTELEKQNMLGCVNIVALSDHGKFSSVHAHIFEHYIHCRCLLSSIFFFVDCHNVE